MEFTKTEQRIIKLLKEEGELSIYDISKKTVGAKNYPWIYNVVMKLVKNGVLKAKRDRSDEREKMMISLVED